MEFADLRNVPTDYKSGIRAFMEITREKAPAIFEYFQHQGPEKVFDLLIEQGFHGGPRSLAFVADAVANKEAAKKLLAAELGLV